MRHIILIAGLLAAFCWGTTGYAYSPPPNCPSNGSNALTYTTSNNQYQCSTISGGGGGTPGGNSGQFQANVAGSFAGLNDFFAADAYGAKCDGTIIYLGVITTSGSATVHSPAYTFTSADIGKIVSISNPAPVNTYSTSAPTSFTGTIATVSGGNITGFVGGTTVGFNSGPGSNNYQNAALRMYKTDDTTAVQAALNAANASGGGIVLFPPGVCVTGQLTFYGNTRFQGSSQGGTTLMLKNGANTSHLVSYQFASLTGTNGLGGTGNVFWDDIQLDGNRGANTGSSCGTSAAVGDGIKIYGYEFGWTHLLVNYYACDGGYSEWSNSPGSPAFGSGGAACSSGSPCWNAGPDGMETQAHDFKGFYNGGWAWVYNGSHDGRWSDITVSANGLGGVLVEDNGSPLNISEFHGYANGGDDIDVEAPYFTCIDCRVEGTMKLGQDGYELIGSTISTLQLGVTSGSPVYGINFVGTTVTTLNNQAGTGYQDTWANGSVGSVTGNSYTPWSAIGTIGLNQEINNLGGFTINNYPSWPVTFNTNASSIMSMTNGGGAVLLNNDNGQFAMGPPGISSIATDAALDLSAYTTSSNSALVLPGGTTSARPSSPVVGMLRYNSNTPGLEAYYGSAWNALGSGGGGSVSLTASTADLAWSPSPTTGTGSIGMTYSNATVSEGALPVANSGDGQVSGLTFNSSGSASANSTAINAALAAGGRVTIDCPSATPTLYIGATLKLHSNSYLYVSPTCTILASSSSVAPMLENQAVSASWTTLYNNSGIVTNGPLSIIRESDIGGWSTSHSYSQGQYEATAANNIYWESAASCTSASSGTGPSGTGTGISDGTCSWNYVTVNTVAIGNGGFDTGSAAIINWPSHGQSVGNAVWLTPEPDTNSNNLWTGTQTAHTRGGVADSAYFGVFSVVNVNDTNNITVMLNRAPLVAFSGIPMNIKQADQNIQITGNGVWNGDGGSCSTAIACHGMLFAGLNNFKFDGPLVENSDRYAVEFAGVSNGEIEHEAVGSLGTTWDNMKIYGPAFNVNIHDFSGSSQTETGGTGDDFFTMQPEEDSSYAGYVVAAGDITNIRISSMSSFGGNAFAIYDTNPYLFVDAIDISHIALDGGESSALWIQGDSSATGPIGVIHVHDISQRYAGNNGNAPIVYMGGNFRGTIAELNIDNINYSPQGSATGNPTVFQDGAGTINQLNIDHVTGSGTNNPIYLYGGTINNMVLSASNFMGNYNEVVELNGATVNNLTVTGTYVPSSASGALVDDHEGTHVNLINNYFLSSGEMVLDRTGGEVIYAANNYAPNVGNGLVYILNTGTTTFYSGGGNTTGSNSFFSFGSAGTVTPYGFDIHCDVTKMTRTTGAYCYNTNTSPGSGTLNTAGNVMDQGTTSNSWFLMSNASGQQY